MIFYQESRSRCFDFNFWGVGGWVEGKAGVSDFFSMNPNLK